jgi:hypothetical protein
MGAILPPGQATTNSTMPPFEAAAMLLEEVSVVILHVIQLLILLIKPVFNSQISRTTKKSAISRVIKMRSYKNLGLRALESSVVPDSHIRSSL